VAKQFLHDLDVDSGGPQQGRISTVIEVLRAERLRLVQKVRTKSSSITALAVALKRDPKSVRRDVLKLERAGLLQTREQINSGYGRVKIVEPVASKYRFTAVI